MFKIGEKVRIREDLKAGYEYGKVTFLASMERFKGMEVTIDSIDDDYDYDYDYKIVEDNGRFYFSEEMLEPIEDREKISTDNKLEFTDNEKRLILNFLDKEIERLIDKKIEMEDELMDINCNIEEIEELRNKINSTTDEFETLKEFGRRNKEPFKFF